MKKNTDWRSQTKTPKRFKPSDKPGTTSKKSSGSPPKLREAPTDEPLQKLQRTLRIRFHDASLLRQALTHRSYNNEHPGSGLEDNERLEYLGDAVLELIAAEHLFHTYQTSDEGELTRLRASVVNTKSLARLASRLSLGDFLLLGKGAHKTGARSLQSILANTFEAVIGAIFLDQGYRAAYKVFSRSLIDVQAWPDDNYKGRLQEVTQERFLTTPQYDIVSASGPGHRREYTAEVTFGNGIQGTGRGKTKRAAEQLAAREALAALGELDRPKADDEVLDAVAAHEAKKSQ